MGLVVSLFVMFAGFKIAKETIMPLLGEAADREIYTLLTNKVESYDGIIGSHDLIAHNYGPSHTMATIHVEVANNSNLEEIHETIDKIEKDVLSETGIFLVIHMDPVEINDKNVLEKKYLVINIVEDIEPKATIHDFRVVNGEHVISFIFDLVVPPFYNEREEQDLLIKISEQISQINEKYQCTISIEKNYIAEL